MAKAIHSMIRVSDEQESVDFYQQAFGFAVEDKLEFDGFTLIYLRNEENDFEIELTINHDSTESYTHGSGYGHIAVCVDDLDAEHRKIEGLGYSPAPIKEFHYEGRLIAKFFFVQDPDGYKIEVLMRHGRYV
jgi:lactoylglutathione lyase